MITESPSKLHVEAVKDIQFNIPTRILLGPGPSMVSFHVYSVRCLPRPSTGSELSVDCTQQLLKADYLLTVPIFEHRQRGDGETAIANMVEAGDETLGVRERLFRFAPTGGTWPLAMRAGLSTSANRGVIFLPQAKFNRPSRERPAKVVAIVRPRTSTGALRPMRLPGLSSNQAAS